ncbi:MAG TPA: putative metal-dependent hydrolase, partial [Chitinophagales bacterium]|nr:putative metal-dependent hydrolase [Chitinophagales bacterium]
MSTDRQYPIGKYIRPTQFDAAALQQHIQTISDFPADIQKLADALTPMQLNMSYRPGGWTSRQVIHHCADSHMNSFIRFKLALTEDNPAIKPYMEAAWAEMADYQQASITESLQIIHGLHARWTILLRNMQEADFHKTVFHPQQDRTIPLY